MCRKTEPIKRANFDCGHIIAEKNGDTLELNNLRPICKHCNTSMSTENMDDFMKKYGFDKINVNVKKRPSDSESDSEDNDDEYEKYSRLPTKERTTFINNGNFGLLDITELLIRELDYDENGNTEIVKRILRKYNVDISKKNHRITMYGLLHSDIELMKLLEEKNGKSYYNKGRGIKKVIIKNDIVMIKYLLNKSKYKDDNRKIIPTVLNNIGKGKKDNIKYKEMMELLKDICK
jgi:hypothetical protein